MVAVLLFFLAAASAAPQYYHHHHYPHHHPPPPPPNFGLDPFIRDDIFDTRSFWEELSRELQKIDDVLEDFSKHFPSSQSSVTEEDGFYKITISLDGYNESDIVVKAKDGVLMIQATHISENAGIHRNYLDLRTLPDNVSPEGKWSYDGGVLRMAFPLKSTEQTTTEKIETTTEIFTSTAFAQAHSREQMESKEDTGENKMDADVGLHNRGDNELLTNEIPRRNTVEATTYAVDLKNEVEFVPVRY